MKPYLILTVLALSTGLAPLRAVPVAAFDFTGGSRVGTLGVTLGFDFDVHSTVQVTHLGLFDSNDNGLSSSHLVGLWSDTGTLLSQVTIPSGTTAPSDDSFRYVALTTPLVLTAGKYVVGAQVGNFETYVQHATAVNLTGLLSYGTSRAYTDAIAFAFPYQVNPFGDDAGYFGPNLKVEAVATGVPDGGGLPLVAIALLGLVGAGRRWRRQAV